MKSLKKKATALAVSALMLAGFSVAALAEEALIAPAPAAEGIAIQLNGQDLALKNGAEPIINAENGRVYLPFRGLFETLGATVSWDENSGLITAVKDGREVQFISGQPAMVIKENGQSKLINTGASPYIANGQTLIPVRFAGEALGYNVGWDSTNKTVVMLDAEALAEKYAGKFGYMQKFLDLNNAYSGKTLDYDAVMNMYIIDPGSEVSAPSYGEMQMNMIGSTKPNGNTYAEMTIKESDALTSAMDLEALGYVREAMFEGGEMEMQVLCDFDNMVMYMKSPLLNEQSGFNADADVWYSMDLTALGLDAVIQQAMEQGNQVSTVYDMIVYIISSMDLNSVDDYAEIEALLQEAVRSVGDEAFTLDGQTYISSTDNVDVAFVLNGAGQMTDYYFSGDFGGATMFVQGNKDAVYMFFVMDDYGFVIGMDMDMTWKVNINSDVKVSPYDYSTNPTIVPLF